MSFGTFSPSYTTLRPAPEKPLPAHLMASLAAVPQAIALFPQFIAHQPETLVLKEHVMSLTGDSFSIKLANGTPILQVEGKVMSISGRKKVCDMQGVHLFDIVKEHLHIHATYVAEAPDGKKLLEVKSGFKCELLA
jgi:hypothetical protein